MDFPRRLAPLSNSGNLVLEHKFEGGSEVKWGRALAVTVVVVCAMGMAASPAGAETAGGASECVWFGREGRGGLDVGFDAPRAGVPVTVHDVATGVDRAPVVGTRFRAPGSEWYADGGFVGSAEPATELFELPVASWVADMDAGFVAL
ncbi:hypothetical protein [Actinophytocola sp. KF-1]